MRTSPLRHTLAVLRTTLGLTQKEMAAVLECSTPTIQAVELGKLKLSDKLGSEIAIKTGVGLPWLLTGDVTSPIVDKDGRPYSRALFERITAKQFNWNETGDNYVLGAASFTLLATEIARATLAAADQGNADLLSYRLYRAIETICNEFKGYNSLVEDWQTTLTQKVALVAKIAQPEIAKHEAARQAAAERMEDAYRKKLDGKLSSSEFVSTLRAGLKQIHEQLAARRIRHNARFEPFRETLAIVAGDFLQRLNDNVFSKQEKLREAHEKAQAAEWEAKRRKNPKIPLLPPYQAP